MYNADEQNVHLKSNLNTSKREIPFAKNKEGVDITFIENNNYRKFFSKTDKYCLLGFLDVVLLRNKHLADELFDEKGLIKLNLSPTLQSTMCFSCILKAKYKIINNILHLSLQIAIAKDYVALFNIPLDINNKYFREIIKTLGVNFYVNDLERKFVYIELSINNDNKKMYVKAFKFMNSEALSYLKKLIENYVMTSESIDIEDFTLSTSRYLYSL